MPMFLRAIIREYVSFLMKMSLKAVCLKTMVLWKVFLRAMYFRPVTCRVMTKTKSWKLQLFCKKRTNTNLGAGWIIYYWELCEGETRYNVLGHAYYV